MGRGPEGFELPVGKVGILPSTENPVDGLAEVAVTEGWEDGADAGVGVDTGAVPLPAGGGGGAAP